MKVRRFVLLLVSAFCFGHFAGAAVADGVPLWADLEDIATWTPSAMPDASVIQSSTRTDKRFWQGAARFLFGLHLERAPQTLASSDTVYRAAAMMTVGAARSIVYRKFEIEVGGQPRAVVRVDVLEDVELHHMHFHITAGLIDRLVVLEDYEDDIKMVFPLGVGGLDENVLGIGKRILTPRYQHAFLNRATVQPRRGTPSYYRHQPYMPITNAAGTVTPVAFHITILSDDDWDQKGPNFLQRGFESHACMRLRQKDLQQFYTIVEHSADAKIPVGVDYFVSNIGPQEVPDRNMGEIREIHPYPFEANSYETVTNLAGRGRKPRAGRDPIEHLLIMNRVNHAPDLTGLNDFNANDVTDLRMFEGLTSDLEPL